MPRISASGKHAFQAHLYVMFSSSVSLCFSLADARSVPLLEPINQNRIVIPLCAAKRQLPVVRRNRKLELVFSFEGSDFLW